MSISKKSWLGIARETTAGTAVTTPTLFIPSKSTMKGTRKTVSLDEERGTRDAVFGVLNTTQEGAVDVKGNFYPDTHGYFLLGALGAVSSASVATGVYKHTFSLADVPPSFTLMKSYDAVTYYMPYSVVEKFSIKIVSEGKLVEMDTSLKSLFPVKLGTTAPTPTYSGVHPFIGYAPTLTVGGSSTTDIDDLSVEFDQKITLWYPAGGVPDWTTAYFGERSVKVDFTARFDTDTNYLKFVNGTIDTVQIDVKGDLINTTYYDEFFLELPYVHYDSAEHDLGKDNVLVKMKGQAFNGGANGLIESCWLQNAITSYAS
jgi:hypothetical protein